MCRQAEKSRSDGIKSCEPGIGVKSQAFFSLDAAFALLIAIFSISLFALLSQAASSSSLSQSQQTSSELLALRLSSFVLEQAAKQGGEWSGYAIENELDEEPLAQIDLQGILAKTGRKFAGVYIQGEEGELFRSEAGQAGNEKFCARRLAILSGKAVRLEACIS